METELVETRIVNTELVKTEVVEAELVKTETKNRRQFLRAASHAAFSIAGLGVAAMASVRTEAAPKAPKTLNAPKTLTFQDIPTLGLLALPGLNLKADVHVLNYALALEDLESELYRQCVARLTTGGTTWQGTPIPGLNLDPHEIDVHHITQFWYVEEAHRDFLRGALKIDGILPHIGIRPKMYNFGMETMSREQILAMLIDVEATGVSAYLGAIPHFGTKLFLTAAAGILGTEARHTATLQTIQNRLLMDGVLTSGTPAPPAPLAKTNHGLDTPLDPDTVLAKVSPYIIG